MQGQKDVIHEITSGNAQLSGQINHLSTAIRAGFNATQNVIRDDGDKTRSMITQNMITELNNTIAELRTRATVADSGVNVTNNINQNQQQQQQQHS